MFAAISLSLSLSLSLAFAQIMSSFFVSVLLPLTVISTFILVTKVVHVVHVVLTYWLLLCLPSGRSLKRRRRVGSVSESFHPRIVGSGTKFVCMCVVAKTKKIYIFYLSQQCCRFSHFCCVICVYVNIVARKCLNKFELKTTEFTGN